ncbi:MAG: hypothetical protein ACLQNE_16625 [Thermoguttaceae bacterium]
MNAHKQFFEYLDSLPAGTEAKKALIEYKLNEDAVANKLNGHLRGCVPDNKFAEFGERLGAGIRAQNQAPFTVYRMTTPSEFSAPLIPFSRCPTFPYLAFMSTSRSPQNLHSFIQNQGIPVLLEIDCPEMTMMALMDGGDLGGMEDEYLLGAQTRFRLIDLLPITDADQFQVVQYGVPHTQMYKIRLQVAENPTYTAGRETFKFDPTG